MAYKINFERYSENFSLPAEIAGDEISTVAGDYLKVILLIFKNADKNYSANLLSNLLNLPEKRVSEAISYWISRGILIEQDSEKISPEVIVISKRTPQPVFPPKESMNGELAFLLECMENQLKRPITSVEYKSIVHIMETIRLPADVILMAVEYCTSIEKANIRYIEKVCATWADNGITTHELAEQYLSLIHILEAPAYFLGPELGFAVSALNTAGNNYSNNARAGYNTYGAQGELGKELATDAAIGAATFGVARGISKYVASQRFPDDLTNDIVEGKWGKTLNDTPRIFRDNPLYDDIPKAVSSLDDDTLAMINGTWGKKVANKGVSNIIDSAMPNVQNATINPDKLIKYALNSEHPIGGNKAKVFESALGYNQSNADSLIKQVYDKLPNSKAILGKLDTFGQRYTIDMPITGLNGNTVIVRTGWIINPDSNIPKLITIYVRN